eukprot:CAMPEP_0206145358 /NCGR_PEP_ID=MMETSP1473-20131121/27115_1 /ASSEMBLY_ACC=CAM_ASM_001109 /TAXON_ID=1461547 /ORGANISM="Stichococcus sp, Strain RCC1054" /LENGTH=137 /DNA_ID=CAMNT_0053541527 /DNA_START=521 /DNA_END=935 /DNA_ORIENTATION=-
MDPKSKSNAQLGAPLRIGENCSFYSFRASNYKLHFYETLSGLKIVLNTDENANDLRELMHYIYASIYVEYVTKNPLNEPGKPFNYDTFTSALNKHLRLMGNYDLSNRQGDNPQAGVGQWGEGGVGNMLGFCVKSTLF